MKILIFDYDGTLHDSIKIYAPAFRLAYEHLVSFGMAVQRNWSDNEISHWLGFSSKDMWNEFMPDLPQEWKDRCSQMIGDKMLCFIQEGKAELYPHSLEVLQQLKTNGYRLIFLSNCKRNYMEAHIKQFKLDEYFSDFYCTESYNFIPKYEIFTFIKQKHSGDYIVIGDRFQDMEIAKKYNLKSIGCKYGYGDLDELVNASIVINNIIELTKTISFL